MTSSRKLDLPDINWIESSIAGNNHLLYLNNAFSDFANAFGLTQIVVDFPTNQSSTMDIFSNQPNFSN